MSSAPTTSGPKRSLFRPPVPGYWKTKTRLERLIRFKHLIIHHLRWPGESQTVPSLAELFPGENLKEATFETALRIEREIRENLMVISYFLQEAGIATEGVFVKDDPGQVEQVKERYDLILDYFVMLNSHLYHQAFEALIARLDMGIGMYKARLRQAKRDLCSPVAWLAYLIRLPITILERAGLASHPDSQQIILTGYGKFLKTLIVLILLLIAVRLGVTIPWKEIVQWAIGFLK